MKIKQFLEGRKNIIEHLRTQIFPADKILWFHCASLGEFEQGLPIMEECKKLFPAHKLLITFFSASGHEIKKNDPIADFVSYLPLDSPKNVEKFIETVRPVLAVFVKYEVWPNILFELKKNEVPTLLVSGLFRPQQLYFKWYGGFMRKALQVFSHIFVQDEESKILLNKINIENVILSGDTRFDRVKQFAENKNILPPIERFKGNSLLVVCGSTWPEDEALLLGAMNTAGPETKFVVAPHKIDPVKIQAFQSKLKKESLLFSNSNGKDLTTVRVLIIDSIGLLKSIYGYADVAYVGGAAGNTGLHNILEAAVFGVPLITGNTLDKFPEAHHLKALGGLFPVGDAQACAHVLNNLLSNRDFREKTGNIAARFITDNTGATTYVMDYIKGKLVSSEMPVVEFLKN